MNIKLDLNDIKKLVTESVKRILKENFEIEGGNAITQAEPIRGDLAGKIANSIIKNIESNLDCQCLPLGSTGKKRADQTSGDIDISVSLPWDRRIELQNLIHRLYGRVEEFFATGLKIYSIGFPYKSDEGKKIVQVDFMFSRDPNYSAFMHFSPDFTKNESQYKGVFRTVLLRTLPKVMQLDPEKYHNEDYGEDDFEGRFIGKPKTWWKYSLDMEDGLLILHRSSVGKTKMLKNDFRIPQDTVVVSDNIDEIVKIILGDKATPSVCNSWESLVNFIFSDDYKYKSEENLNFIFDYFFKCRDIVKTPEIAIQMYDIVANKMKENGYNFQVERPIMPENNL